MKTKEQVIKEVWGEESYNKVKHNINNNGWLYFGYCCNGWDDVEDWLSGNNLNTDRGYYDMTYFECQDGDLVNVKIRPKSLKGIEDNNGWVVADKDTLPDSGVYKVGRFNSSGDFYIISNEYSYTDLPKLIAIGCTHYRPVEVIPNPLY